MRKYLEIMLIMVAIVVLVALVIWSTPIRADKLSNFDVAMQTVLKHEGGLTNDKSDPGGITDYGISLRYLKEEHIDVNGDGKIDANDIIHLTKPEADHIYYMDWWKRYKFNRILDSRIATKIFDTSVNMGVSRTAKITKLALNRVIANHHLVIDGKLDDQTIDIINNFEPVVFLDAFRYQERQFYLDIIKNTPRLAVFKDGWLARAAS